MLHRYEAAQPQTTEDEEASVCSTSYSASQVLARSSKKGASCRAVCFAADGQTLLAGFATGSILQLDSGTGKLVARMTKAHSAGINRMLALSGQQQLLAAGDDSGNISIWDLRSQESVYQYKQHTDFISGLAQHHTSGKQQQDMLVAVSGDGTLSVHDLRSRQLVARSETDADDELLSGEVTRTHGCMHATGMLASIARLLHVCVTPHSIQGQVGLGLGLVWGCKTATSRRMMGALAVSTRVAHSAWVPHVPA